MTTRKILAQHDTADFGNCVNRGYSYTLYADGRLAAEYHSRWAGSYNGARYTTEPGFVSVDGIDPDDPDNDALAALIAAVEDINPEFDSAFRPTRKGRLVQ